MSLGSVCAPTLASTAARSWTWVGGVKYAAFQSMCLKIKPQPIAFVISRVEIVAGPSPTCPSPQASYAIFGADIEPFVEVSS